MSGYRPPPCLPAPVGPLASLVLRREFGAAIAQHAEQLSRSPSEVNRQAARQLLDALDAMGESARQWRARESGGPVSASGQADTGTAGTDADCDSHGGSPSQLVLSAGEVAKRTGYTRRHVTRLCQRSREGEAGGLLATWTGRQWLIEEAVLMAWQAAKEPVA